MTREQRLAALRKELANLKAELAKAHGSYKRSVIQDEIRSVCKELIRLEDR